MFAYFLSFTKLYILFLIDARLNPPNFASVSNNNTVDSLKLEYSISRIFVSLNKFFGPLNITHFFTQENSRYLEYLGRSNKIVGPLDDFLLFSRTFVLIFRPKFKSSKVRTFYSIFW